MFQIDFDTIYKQSFSESNMFTQAQSGIWWQDSDGGRLGQVCCPAPEWEPVSHPADGLPNGQPQEVHPLQDVWDLLGQGEE